MPAVHVRSRPLDDTATACLSTGQHLSLLTSELVCKPFHADDLLLLAPDLILQAVLLPGIPAAERKGGSEIKGPEGRASS